MAGSPSVKSNVSSTMGPLNSYGCPLVELPSMMTIFLLAALAAESPSIFIL